MFFRSRSSQPAAPPSADAQHQLRLEIAGRERVERISKVTKSMPWQVLLLELAWTAGPATFIAAAGGYYLGFGKELPTENAIFFVGYTIIFGVIGIATNLVHRTVWQPRKQHAERQLSHTLDMLPDLFMSVRELRLDTMDTDSRRMESVGYLLRKVDLDPQTITLLVEELTNDVRLAALAGKIEIYRRAGLYGRMQELVDESREAATRATVQLSATAPETTALLNNRLFGRSPTYEEGLPRLENFIERILAATESGDDKLMTLEDAEQVVMLGFEFLSGLKLQVLTFAYMGRWEIARAMDKLNERWNRYRIAKAGVYSRLKALEEFLATSSATDMTLSAPGQTSARLSRTILSGIRALNDDAQAILALPSAERRLSKERFDALSHTISEALRLQAAAQRACSHVGRRYDLFQRNLQAWEALTAQHQAQTGMLQPSKSKTGLQLTEWQITLNDKEKLELAACVDDFLQEHRIRTHGNKVVYGPTDKEKRLTPELAKTLAIRLLLKLEDLIEITRPDVQRAIYASPAANLHGLEAGQSAAAKAGLGAAAVQEVQQDIGAVAERLATVLVNQYQIELTAEAIEFLHRTYAARTERLEMLAGTKANSRRMPANAQMHAGRYNLAKDPAWQAEVKRAKRILKLAK